MSKYLAGLGSNAGKMGAGAVVVAVLALGVWVGSKRDVADVMTPVALMQPEGDTAALPTPDAVQAGDTAPQPSGDVSIADTTDDTTAKPQVVTDPATALQIAAPAFDEVRREADGMTVVAGRAAPGASVRLLRDGEVIATATADGSGKFATLAMIAPDGQGHVLSLSQRVDGADIASQDEIILAPTQAPVDLAEGTPEAPVQVNTAALAPNQTSDAETVVADTPAPSTPKIAASTEIEDTSALQTTVAETTTANTTDVAVLKSTAEGVELLNPAAPDVMSSVALDTISYSDEGDVQLAGRAQPDTQTVRVYLDNDAVINLPVDEQGRWRGDVPDVDEGIYTLRVDEVGADGSVTSRVETPFKRESAAVLTQAAAAQEGPIKAIIVQKGATLWAIARERYGDGQLYVRVFEANAGDIRDPDLIYPGQVFDLPD